MMDAKENINQFADDLDRLVQRHTLENDISYAAAIGVLAMKQHTLLHLAEGDWKNGKDES